MNIPTSGGNTTRFSQIERREWSLSWLAIFVTLLLTVGIASLALSMFEDHIASDRISLGVTVRGLVGLVLIVDLYYQQRQIQKMRRQLIEREQLFNLISDNAVDMIAIVDPDGKRIYNSPSYQRILGYSPEELAATPSSEQVHPDDRQLVMDTAAEALHSGQGCRPEYRMLHKNGDWISLESTGSPIVNAKGEIEGLVIVNRDISERRRLETQLQQSQKMDAIGRLSGGVAHDFNNLLGLIIGYAEILQERIPEGDPLRSCVDQILKAGTQGASLTRQLLAFSRQQVLAPKALSLNAVVTDVGKMLRRLIGEDVDLITKLDTKLGNIRADQGQIEQVIMNLAVNARDAMPDGGKLTIETVNQQIDDKFARRFAFPVLPGPYVRLSMSDTGAGMDAAIQQKIFDPFFTTKEKGKGTGLGLSTVYGVVKQSGGYIIVDSAPGKGATFAIYLPQVDQEAEVETRRTGPAGLLRGTEMILLVEDEDGLRTATRRRLELQGYTVLEAADGAAALAVSDQTSGIIHLLLTDIVMPGISGRILADQMKLRRPDIKVLFVSGYTGQQMGQEVLEPGSHFLQKPFTREDLTRKVREVLGTSSAVPIETGD
jgi:two-component system, cell cycle sensor histidine kinase and response regulator CckA